MTEHDVFISAERPAREVRAAAGGALGTAFTISEDTELLKRPIVIAGVYAELQDTDTLRRPLLTGGVTEILNRERVLYLVTSGAPAPEGIPELVTLCYQDGWRVLVFATPHGARFLDLTALGQLTGQPVRTDYRMPGESSTLPPADAILACPLTFNSVNKFANGHADNFAISLLCELAGSAVPVIIVPHCKPQLATHPAFPASLTTLRGMGVTVLFDPKAPYERRLPPWRDVIAALPSHVPAR